MSDDTTPPLKLRQFLWKLAPLAWMAVLGVALWALHREWAGFHLADLNEAFSRIGLAHMALALACTALGFFCNAALDLFALRWLGVKLPRWRVLGTSFVAGIFAMNAGGTILGGGAVRLRFYTREGLTPGQTAKVTGFVMIQGWLGHALLAGSLLCIAPPPLEWLSAGLARGVGAALLTLCGVAVFGARITGFGDRWPAVKIALPALIISALDWAFAGLAIRVLLPEQMGVTTISFMAAVAIAQLLSALSHVPGGVGVLELAITKLAGAAVSAHIMAGALLTYRFVYYLLPFGIAAAVLGIKSVPGKARVARGAARVWSTVAPRAAAWLSLAGGFVLLLSASVPMERDRREILQQWVPLPFVEASNFLSSVIGMALIIVARGLMRRANAAWWLAILLTASGIVFSLLKGLDWEEAVVLSVLLACLLPAHRHFHRPTRLWSQRFSVEWWVLLAVLTGVAIWLGWFTTRHQEYSSDLWWQFSFEGDASRFLRGTVAMGVILLGVVLAQMLRVTAPPPPEAEPDWPLIERLVNAAPQTQATLAFLGDKHFLFSEARDAFLMYGEKGRTRVIMGDPVGDAAAGEELLWEFVEAARDAGQRPVMYQISAAILPQCVEMGLRIFKLGEEARVPLRGFTLDGPARKFLRKYTERMKRDRWQFSLWPVETVAARLEELRAISDAWLELHSAKEKAFSLGCFDDDYVRRFPVAVMEKDGQVGAFATLLPGNGRDELSIDLMRHRSDPPNGLMDALFAALFVWGRDHGYEWFTLGMAPLSGLRHGPLTPLWNQLGAVIFQYGGKFYNFTGLRAWKEKYQPVWEPRYLAVPGLWDLPGALLDITALIGGGRDGTAGKRRAAADTPPNSAT